MIGLPDSPEKRRRRRARVKYGFYLYFTIRYYESKFFEEEVAENPNLWGRCALVWYKCHVSNDPEGSKLCPQGTISFFSLMPL